MVTRTLGILLLGLLVVGVMAGPVLATEAEVHAPTMEEIRENASDVGVAFLTPDEEEQERPGFFDWIIYPVAAIGVLMTFFVVAQYLVFQPRFAREAEARAKR